jgi:hypothetical protein
MSNNEDSSESMNVKGKESTGMEGDSSERRE